MIRFSLRKLLRAQPGVVPELEDLLGEPLVLVDARGKTVYGALPSETIPAHTLSCGGEVVGELLTQSTRGAQAARMLARLFTSEWDKRKLASETLERYHELNLLYDMGNQLSRVLDIDDVSRVVVTEAERFLDAACADVLLISPEASPITAAVSCAEDGVLARLGWDALSERVAERGRAELTELAGRSLIVAPMRSGEEVLGVLRLASAPGALWTAGELKLVTTIATHAASALHHAMLRHDHLRRYALDMLEQHGTMLAQITTLAASDVASNVAHMVVKVLDFQACVVLMHHQHAEWVCIAHHGAVGEQPGLWETLGGASAEQQGAWVHRDPDLPWEAVMVAPLDVAVSDRLERVGLCVGLGPSPRSSENLDLKGLEVLADLCSGGLRTVLARERERTAIGREAEARASARVRGQFLANMSHEIRTPMNAVIGMTEMLLRTSLSPQQQRYAEHIESCGRALLSLINDILDVSKVEAGKLELHTADFNPRACLEASVAMLAKQGQDKGLEVACILDPELPAWLHGDEDRLRQILVNLLGNAIKFTEEGEVCLEARVEKQEADAVWLHVSIRDTGIGIPQKARAQIFESFTQADPSHTRRFGGTGLGTTIAQQLVALMDGTIGVESEVGAGSTFWFVVRLTSARASSPPQPEPLGLRVLLVEPHAASRAGLEASLRALGTEVLSAASEEHARALWTEESVDAVLVVPEMLDGLREARDSGSGTRWIGVHALTQPFPEGETLLLDATLVKPAQSTPLYAALTGHVERKSEAGFEGLGQPAVLLVEDNPINQELAVDMLHTLGCRVEVAGHGQEAYALLEDPSHGFALVLMDCQMPVWDGYRATREIRELEARQGRARLPIVALTAHALNSEHEKARAAGMDAVVTKPIRLSGLREALVRWLPKTIRTPRPVSSAITPPRTLPSSAPPSLHDLRTPLNAILGYSDLLLDDVGEIAERLHSARDDFARIQSSGKELLSLIDALSPHLFALRAEAGSPESVVPLSEEARSKPRRMQLFLTHGPHQIEALERAVAQRDISAITLAAHRLRGGAMMCGLMQLGERAGVLEEAARRGVLDDVDADLASLLSLANTLLEQMREALG